MTLEAGYFVTPNVTIALATGVPPIEHLKATGFTNEPLYGTNLLGQRARRRCYVPPSISFVSFDQNFALVLQAGSDWMLTPNWGVFVDGKKLFFSTDAQRIRRFREMCRIAPM